MSELVKWTMAESKKVTAAAVTLLPSEIWVKIFSQIGQKDLVRMRGVSSTWRNVIDEHFNFSVIVHEEKTDMNRLYELKVKDCLVTKLLEDENILQYPELLRRIRFWGPVSIRAMHRILDECINVEELSLTKCPLAQKNIFPEKLHLNKLKKLELLGYCCKDAADHVCKNVVNLLSNKIPHISKVFININCNWEMMDLMLASFFEFLATHRKTIKNVNVALVPAALIGTISNRPTRISEETKSLVYRDLQLESFRLTAATKYINTWAPLLKNQTGLKQLRVHWVCSGEPPNPNQSGILCSIFYPALAQSSLNLVLVDLRDVNLFENGQVTPFDGSVFQCAQNLRRLVLVRNKDDCQRSNLEVTLTNINLNLPCLEDLEIIRFKCKSGELQVLIDSTQVLKTVKLHHTGSCWGQGVNGGILESITGKPAIKMLNIVPMNTLQDPEENKKLDSIRGKFEGIYIGADHLYFDFVRFRQGIKQPHNNSRYHFTHTTTVVEQTTSRANITGFNMWFHNRHYPGRLINNAVGVRRSDFCVNERMNRTRSTSTQHFSSSLRTTRKRFVRSHSCNANMHLAR